MDQLYDLVFGMVERRFDADTRERFASWLRSVQPTQAHMAVMMVEMALLGKPMGECHLVLAEFKPNGEPVIHLLQ